jgi:hypothetical protein
LLAGCSQAQQEPWWAGSDTSIRPGCRVLLDAHNCYPEYGRWADRIERALSTGVPLAIEQDLVWYTDPESGKSWSIVTHGEPFTGDEPTLRDYFFERIRPIVEKALQSEDKQQWPLITLSLDFKTNEPEHHEAIWDLLGEYESWLCTAERVANPKRAMPIDVKPVLVLTGSADEQEDSFHDAVPVGGRLRLFGAVHVHGEEPEVPAGLLVPHRATNYRRWWNNPWKIVEKGGQKKAKEWTKQEMARLKSLVDHAHAMGLWIRFYTLNGHWGRESRGWSKGYNFGPEERIWTRWRAVIEAGVDYVATDQYEDFAAFKAKVGQELKAASPS